MTTLLTPSTPPSDTTASPPTSHRAPPRVDNRLPYLAWGLAYLLGYGLFALSKGPTPLLALPAALPAVVLVVGLFTAAAVSVVSVIRAKRGGDGAQDLPGTLFGISWIVGFMALFLLITALAGTLDDERVQTLLWPVGSGLVVGLLYMMGGALDRDLVQYGLGTWLALVTAAGLFLGTPGLYWVLALVGSAGYLTASALDHRSRTAPQA